MGYKNVSGAFALYPHLPHAAMRLLLFMALSTQDERGDDGSPARVSWLGREQLAGALGMDVPPEPEPWTDTDEADRARAARHSAFVVVARQIKVLTDAGAIERLRSGGRNRSAEYLLNVDPFEQGQRNVGPVSQRNVGPKGQRNVGPERDKKETQENPEDNHQSGAPSHLGGRSPVDNDEDSAARKVLERVGPERQQRYLQAAADEGITITSALIRRAAQLAGAPK